MWYAFFLSSASGKGALLVTLVSCIVTIQHRESHYPSRVVKCYNFLQYRIPIKLSSLWKGALFCEPSRADKTRPQFDIGFLAERVHLVKLFWLLKTRSLSGRCYQGPQTYFTSVRSVSVVANHHEYFYTDNIWIKRFPAFFTTYIDISAYGPYSISRFCAPASRNGGAYTL